MNYFPTENDAHTASYECVHVRNPKLSIAVEVERERYEYLIKKEQRWQE
jgi:hypothetical protein